MPVAMDLHSDESLPKYIKAIQGLDETWKERARCRGRGLGARRVWFLEDDHPGIDFAGKHITGNDLAKIALGECRRCPVQWQCTTYAIMGEQDYCIWGCRAGDRKWLAGRTRHPFQGDWLTEMARSMAKNEAVIVMVNRLRKDQRRVGKQAA